MPKAEEFICLRPTILFALWGQGQCENPEEKRTQKREAHGGGGGQNENQKREAHGGVVGKTSQEHRRMSKGMNACAHNMERYAARAAR